MVSISSNFFNHLITCHLKNLNEYVLNIQIFPDTVNIFLLSTSLLIYQEVTTPDAIISNTKFILTRNKVWRRSLLWKVCAHIPPILHPWWNVGMKETLSTQQLREQKRMHTMLLCKIIVGKQQLGRKGMTQPNDGFDSARNGDGTYFVIFNFDHILPVAIIEYSVLRGSRG